MKKIKEGEEFQLGSQVFTYSINESGAVAIKIVNKKVKSKPVAFIPPTLEEVKAFFKEEGYNEETAVKAFKHYTFGKWHDARGNPVKNWRQKMSNNWMKEENKIKEQKPQKESKDPKFLF